MFARQSTALELSVGPVLDADGVAVTDCVVGDFKIKKTTSNFAALNGSATLTHVSAGTYDLVLTTSDTDTVGFATVAIDDTVNTCGPVRLQVVEEAVYDALFAASATGMLPANVTQWGGSATPVTNFTTVYSTDFATAYDATRNMWNANVKYVADVAAGAGADRTLVLETTIASVTSQTILVLTDGAAEDDAYNGCPVLIEDVSTATQKATGLIVSDYVGGSKTLTLEAAPSFTVAATDKLVIYPKNAAGGVRGTHVGNTTGNRTGNVVGTVQTVLANGPGSITVASIEVGAFTSNAVASGFLTDVAFTNALANRIADHVLRRLAANAEAGSYGDTPGLGSLYGLVQQSQESNLVDNPGFLTVYKTDGTTELGQKAVTTDGAAEAVTGIS